MRSLHGCICRMNSLVKPTYSLALSGPNESCGTGKSDDLFCDEGVTGSPTAALQIRHMIRRYTLGLGAAVIAAQLAGCASQAVPAFSYYPVPCPPAAVAGAPPAPNAASPGESPPSATLPPSAPAAGAPTAPGAPDAAGPHAAPAANCVVAVPDNDYDYAAGYHPYWDYGWPYYGGIGFSGFVDGRFHRGFHDHDFHGGRHAGGFHDGGFHGGGFHGGGGHGGGGHGR
jgi:hypothetical protein